MIEILVKYSKSSAVSSVGHKDFGTQVELVFTENETKTLYSVANEDSMLVSALMEAYNLIEVRTEIIDDDTTLQYVKPQLFTAFLADLIFKINRLPTDEFGRIIYDASKLIVRSDTDAHDKLIDRTMLEHIVKPLVDNKVLFIGEINDHLARWKSLGGVE